MQEGSHEENSQWKVLACSRERWDGRCCSRGLRCSKAQACQNVLPPPAACLLACIGAATPASSLPLLSVPPLSSLSQRTGELAQEQLCGDMRPSLPATGTGKLSGILTLWLFSSVSHSSGAAQLSGVRSAAGRSAVSGQAPADAAQSCTAGESTQPDATGPQLPSGVWTLLKCETVPATRDQQGEVEEVVNIDSRRSSDDR